MSKWNYPIFAIPKSSSINETSLYESSWCLLNMSLKHSQVRNLDKKLVGVSGGQTYSVFLGGDSREQHFQILQMYKISIFSWPVICLFEHSKYIESTQVSSIMLLRIYKQWRWYSRDRICLEGNDTKLHLSLIGNVTLSEFFRKHFMPPLTHRVSTVSLDVQKMRSRIKKWK